MGRLVNLQRRETGYYYRQSVPTHLVHLVGKKELVRSLNTKDIMEAKHQCRVMAIKIADWFKQVESGNMDARSLSIKSDDVKKRSGNLVVSMHNTSHHTLHDLLDHWARYAKGLQTGEQCKASANYVETKRPIDKFTQMFGAIPAQNITTEQVRQFVESYLQSDLSRSSVKKYMIAFKKILTHGADQGLISQLELPHGLFKIEVSDDDTTDVRPYSIDEIERILASPLYSGYTVSKQRNGIIVRYLNKAGNYTERDEFFWLPLLYLFTGARCEEIAQLALSDIKAAEHIHYIHINDSKDYQRLKRGKHNRRIVPIHPELIKIGFLDYIDALRERGEERVFPNLTNNDAEGRFGKNFSKKFRSFIKKLGFKENENQLKLHAMHSFRHLFVSQCHRAGISEREIKSLVGHNTEYDSHGIYTDYSQINQRFSWVAKLDYGIDFSFLHTEEGIKRWKQEYVNENDEQEDAPSPQTDEKKVYATVKPPIIERQGHYVFNERLMEYLGRRDVSDILQLGYDDKLDISILQQSTLWMLAEQGLDAYGDVDRVPFYYAGYMALTLDSIRDLQVNRKTSTEYFQLTKAQIMQRGYNEYDEPITEDDLSGFDDVCYCMIHPHDHRREAVPITLNDLVITQDSLDHYKGVKSRTVSLPEAVVPIGRPGVPWQKWTNLLSEKVKQGEVDIKQSNRQIARMLLKIIESMPDSKPFFGRGQDAPDIDTIALRLSPRIKELR